MRVQGGPINECTLTPRGPGGIWAAHGACSPRRTVVLGGLQWLGEGYGDVRRGWCKGRCTGQGLERTGWGTRGQKWGSSCLQSWSWRTRGVTGWRWLLGRKEPVCREEGRALGGFQVGGADPGGPALLLSGRAHVQHGPEGGCPAGAPTWGPCWLLRVQGSRAALTPQEDTGPSRT